MALPFEPLPTASDTTEAPYLPYDQLVRDTQDGVIVLRAEPVLDAADREKTGPLPPALFMNEAARQLLSQVPELPVNGGNHPVREAPVVRTLLALARLEDPPGVPRARQETFVDADGAPRRVRVRIRRWEDILLFRILDETSEWATERQASRRERLLQGVSRAATVLLSGSWEGSFDEVAEILGEAAGVSRVYLFVRRQQDPRPMVVDQRFEWCAPGIRSELHNPDFVGLDLEAMGAEDLGQTFGRGESFSTLVEDVRNPALSEMFRSQNIQAILSVPIMVRGRWWGFLGFDDCEEARSWSEGEVEVMRTAALLLSAAVERDLVAEASRALEAELRQSHRMDSVGRLAGGMAHDFNNLLTVIQGNVELALANLGPADTDGADDPSFELREISGAAARGARLIQQLLAFARRQVVQPEVLEVNRLAGSLMNFLRPLLGDHIRLELTLDPEAPAILADPGQMEQALMNLVLNARDAMGPGGTLRIETERVELGPDSPLPATFPELAEWVASASGPGLRLAVLDSGPGIPDNILSHIFEPFFTTKPLGEGTGLGLSTVYGIVKQSRGEVVVRSSPEGAAFHLLFPVAPPEGG